MIFSIGDHIQQIKDGEKTETRRPTDRYQLGKTYAIQPGRGKKADPDGRIRMVAKRWESIDDIDWAMEPDNYENEGGYTREDYEALYEKMYPSWMERCAYLFEFIPSEGGAP